MKRHTLKVELSTTENLDDRKKADLTEYIMGDFKHVIKTWPERVLIEFSDTETQDED